MASQNFLRGASKSLGFHGVASGMVPPPPGMTLSTQASFAPGTNYYTHGAPAPSALPSSPTAAPNEMKTILTYAKNPQQQTANHRSFETDAKKQEDALTEEKEKSDSITKLDASLTALLCASNANKELPLLKGIDKNAKTIEVIVQLSDASPANLKKLKEAGFKLIKSSHGSVRGKIQIEKLKVLSEFSFVTLIKTI